MRSLFRSTFLTATALLLSAGSGSSLAARNLYRIKNVSKTTFQVKPAEDSICKRKLKIVKKTAAMADLATLIDLSAPASQDTVTFEPGTILEFFRNDASNDSFLGKFDLEDKMAAKAARTVGELHFFFDVTTESFPETTLTGSFYPINNEIPVWTVTFPEEIGGHDLEIKEAKADKPAGCCTIL